MACLWYPNSSLLEHKYGRNLWKMSKIGQNSMKKWPFFAIILPWMARYGSKRSFLLIFSARDDLVKVSWKSDVGKCQNQLTPPYFDQLSERHQLLYGRFWMEENLQEQGAVPSQGKPTHTALLPYLPTLRVCSLRTQPDNAQLLRHPACRDLRRSKILLFGCKRHCQLYRVL